MQINLLSFSDPLFEGFSAFLQNNPKGPAAHFAKLPELLRRQG